MSVTYSLYFAVVLVLAGAGGIYGSNYHGRLLTPEEGCGFQPPKDAFLMLYHKSWPWIGSVLAYSPDNNNQLTSNCTATLITSRHALTSMNCARNNPLYVRFGETPKRKELIEHAEKDWVVVDKAPGEKLNIFKDIAVARTVIHPNAKDNEVKNNLAILYLAEDIEFSDRIRPACLPTSSSILKNRISTDIFRLVRDDSFDVGQTSGYTPKSYTLLDPIICALIYKINLYKETAFCAEGDDSTGSEGDPFVVKVKSENFAASTNKGRHFTTPTYQVGLNVVHLNRKSGLFLDLYPYVQWINETITGNNKDTEVQTPLGQFQNSNVSA